MRFLLLAAGRRSKFLVLAIAVVIAGALSSQAGNLESIVNDDPLQSLPSESEARQAASLAERFDDADSIPAIVVVARDGGLRADDRAAVDRVAADLRADPPPLAETASPPQLSRDGAAALVAVPLADPGDEAAVAEAVEELRERLGPVTSIDGLDVAVTGGAAFTADLNSVFEGLDGLLLAATGTLVLVLLILIYRSPIFWIIPFVTVLFAEGASRGAGYLLGSAGLTVTGQSSGILSVLVFGAATDYALLIVSRYREELRRHDDAHAAMAAALRGTAPAILASGGTVVAGLLTLSLADVGSTQAIGPLGAAGVAISMVFSLTILPVTLILGGRRAFWPFIPRAGEEHDLEATRWMRFGRAVTRRPRRTWIGASVMLLVLAVGVTGLSTTLTQQDQFTTDVEAVEGQRIISERFQAGATGPADVIVRTDGTAQAVRAALTERRDLVLGVGRPQEGEPGTRLTVILASDPYGADAVASIPELRDVARSADPRAVVGGPTAEAYDLREAAQRDNLVVPPVALLVVFLILVLLLRALVAPAVLLATVVLSFAASLGVATVAWDVVFGFPAADPTLPLLAFVFLVALGVDYNIFLSERAREESARHGTRRGVLIALATTGGVITAAGVVLAGTFSVLAVLPLVLLTQIGTIVAFGVLLDTTVVRSIIVPALFTDIGPRIWWPSSLAREDARERSSP